MLKRLNILAIILCLSLLVFPTKINAAISVTKLKGNKIQTFIDREDWKYPEITSNMIRDWPRDASAPNAAAYKGATNVPFVMYSPGQPNIKLKYAELMNVNNVKYDLIFTYYKIDWTSNDSTDAKHVIDIFAPGVIDFDEKYSNYNYVYDVREMNDNWIITFKNLFSDLYLSKKNNIAILNVGVADGTEAISLFKDFKNITFVDIAQNCLKKIKDYNPNSITILNRAEKLESLKDNQFDRYVSLRTYNSSFFNKIQAIQEAKRVLKPKGKIIISIANGFLDITQKRVIPGLIIPGTEYVDIYRGIETINKLKIILIKNDFININIIPTDSEIYLTADCEKGEK